MRTVTKTFSSFALAALALFSFRSFFVVDGTIISIQTEVQCLLEEPQVCIGEHTELGPTPTVVCSNVTDSTSCKVTYVGGYTYQYAFVEGLPEGTTDLETIEKAKTNSTVTVYTKDDRVTCDVAIGDQSCQQCSTGGCNRTSLGFPSAVKYDCTNFPNGKKSMDVCGPLEPFLYPFDFASGPLDVVTSRMEDQSAKAYIERGQVPFGYIALGMLMFVVAVGIFSFLMGFRGSHGQYQFLRLSI